MQMQMGSWLFGISWKHSYQNLKRGGGECRKSNPNFKQRELKEHSELAWGSLNSTDLRSGWILQLADGKWHGSCCQGRRILGQGTRQGPYLQSCAASPNAKMNLYRLGLILTCWYVKQTYILLTKNELTLRPHWEQMLAAPVLGLIFMVDSVTLLSPNCYSKMGKYFYVIQQWHRQVFILQCRGYAVRK